MKSIKLRKLEISTNNIITSSLNIIDILSERLRGTHLSDRLLPLRHEDADSDADLLSYYVITGQGIKGVILRLKKTDETHTLPNEFLERNSVPTNELSEIERTNNYATKDMWYFYINNSYMVTTLRSNITPTGTQVYLNWLLESLRGSTKYELSDVTCLPEGLKLNEISQISLKNASLVDIPPNSIDNVSTQMRRNIPQNMILTIRNILGLDIATFERLTEENIIQAEILLKFVKPKSWTKENYNRTTQNLLRPISDADDIEIVTKDKRKFKGNQIKKTKIIHFSDTLNSGLNEEELWQEMEVFLNEN